MKTITTKAIAIRKVAPNYSIRDFQKEFPDNNACIEYIFQKKFSNHTCSCGNKKFYRVKGRKTYACSCGKQINPVAGTIFEKSSTPLTLWFFAIFLFSASRNGVSGKELQRQLGITYKCAWRIAKQIRALMANDGDMLSGTIEVDETYIGGKHKGDGNQFKDKSAIMGMVERDGRIKASVIPNRETSYRS
ncbi:MAG: IS1595 family transposase [Candidatus Wolfebacteria bacterium]|nr:IS1595 family transposase [Candidatus Wolfebacteria bacterium]